MPRAFSRSLCVLTLCAAPLTAQVVYVDIDATGAEDGTSWADAYTDLRDAIFEATVEEQGDEIWVAAGLYRLESAGTGFEFRLYDDIAIHGGFAGTETALDQRLIADYPTILSGDIDADDDGSYAARDDNAHNVMIGFDLDDVELSGLILQGAQTEALNLLGVNSLKVRDCVFRDSGLPTNLFSAGVLVAGTAQDSDAASFVDCVFEGNTGSAGGLRVDEVRTSLVNCGFYGNIANDTGGAVRVENPSSVPVVMVNCVLSGNEAEDGGGLAIQNSAPVALSSCTVVHNSATGTASGRASGVLTASDPSALVVRNSVIFGNEPTTSTGDTLGDQLSDGAQADVEASAIEGYDNSFGSGNVASVTLLDPAGDDAVLGTPDDDPRPWFGSASIDAGSDSDLALDSADLDEDANTTEYVPLDADRRARDHDGDGDSSAVTDMGAYEFHGCQKDLGFSGPGPLRLEVCGDDVTQSSASTTLRLWGGSSGQQVTLVSSLTRLDAPVGLGILVPQADSQVVVTLDTNGEYTATIAAGSGSVVTLYVQAVAQLTGIKHFSNAVAVELQL